MKCCIWIVVLFLCWACADDQDPVPEQEEHDLTISGINGEQWTYISLKNGTVTGTSVFGDPEENARWAKRTDWDLAICGEYLRTNSGTSGEGKGGILFLENATYEAVTAAPTGEYITDEILYKCGDVSLKAASP